MTLAKNRFTLLLNICIILIVAYILVVVAMEASRHASDKHGWTLAGAIIECIEKNGPHMGMKFRDKDGKFYIPCQLSDGRIGLGIFDKDGNNVSAYVPGDGIWEHVRDYILRRAFRYTGPLPW